jgi:glycosyltransferase involved in cell wall biosynthesis
MREGTGVARLEDDTGQRVKTALLHHWLVGMRGGERVLEAMAEIFPEADILTLVAERSALSDALRRRKILASWLDAIPFSRRLYPRLLPLHPAAFADLDLRRYDLVTTSDSALAKCARARVDALHVCYCHSPPRYLWDLADEYLAHAGVAARVAARFTFPRLRRIDAEAARHIDHFIANSQCVRDRIERHYGRSAVVIHPPVDAFEIPADCETGDYYLVVGQLVAYKRTALAIEAAQRAGRRLVVIGIGPEMKRLRRLAGESVQFLGWQSDESVRRHMASCKALLFPGEEDFGIVPLECQMAGRPVIAYGKGGALETVIENRTGIFFERQTPDCLADAIREFEAHDTRMTPDACRAQAMRFERDVFMKKFRDFIRERI